MKKVSIISMSVFIVSIVFASNNVFGAKIKDGDKFIGPRVIFEIDKNFKAEKLECKQMDLMNAVFEDMPVCVIRLFKAAVATRKLLDEIENMTPVVTVEETGESVYFENSEEEREFIVSRIKGILNPIEKFLEEALAKSGPVAKALFEKILGEDAKNGFLLPALSSGNNPTKYLLDNINTIDEFVGAISEFWIFFSIVNASLSDNAKKSYNEKLKELQQDQKNIDKKKSILSKKK